VPLGARRTLDDEGAPDEVLASIDPVVPDAHLAGESLTVVATAHGVLLTEHHPDPPARDLVRWAPLPSLVPLLARRQASPAVVAVVADRQGADLVAFRPGSRGFHREVAGDDAPLRKVKAGGWSQRRYQQRAQNTWEQNADEVAREVATLAEQVNARLVVAAGDVRAVQLLREALPSRWVDGLEVVDGSRAEDGSLEDLTEDLRPLVAKAVDEDGAALLERFREERGQHDRAVEGTDGTFTALAKAQVEVLLVVDDPDDDRLAWFGPEATQLARRQDDIEALGVESPQQARLVDVAVRAALGTGAGVKVLPADQAPADGLAALLRWAD
jgi:peptide subunit release factor 1 (eRF1)